MHDAQSREDAPDTGGAPWRHPASAHLPALLLGVAALLLALGGNTIRLALRFQHDDIAHGQLWRLLTCHLVHLGWLHLTLDLAGLVIIWLLVGVAYSVRTWWLLILVIALGISGGLYLLRPALLWYVGLSGLLHGMLTAGALGQIHRRPVESGVILAGLTAKLTWEQLHGPLSGALLAGPVVVDAHLYGSITGAAAAGLLLLASWHHGRRSFAQ